MLGLSLVLTWLPAAALANGSDPAVHTITDVVVNPVDPEGRSLVETYPSGRANDAIFNKNFPINLIHGAGPQWSLDGYTINGLVADIDKPTAADIEIFRVDNNNVINIRETIWRAYADPDLDPKIQKYNDGSGWKHYDQYLVGNDTTDMTMEDALASPYITEGIDNVFLNGPANQPTINNVERVSLSSTVNRASDRPDLAGVTLTERASNDTNQGFVNDRIRAAAVLDVDANGKPIAWGEFVDFKEKHWTVFSEPLVAITMKKDVTNTLATINDRYQPTDISGRGEPQHMGIMFISYADLGVEPGQDVYGISLIDTQQDPGAALEGAWQHTVATENIDEVDGTLWKNGTVDLATMQWVQMELPTTNVFVEKEWDDDDDALGLRPGSVTVNLYRDGSLYDSAVLDDSNMWEHSFMGLPFYVDGDYETESVYTIEELDVPNYVTEIDDTWMSEVGPVFIITNTINPPVEDEFITVTIIKKWEDNNNAKGTRPSSVEVELYRDGTQIATVILSEANNWTSSIDGLPLYQDNDPDALSVYSVKEISVTGYKATITAESLDMGVEFVIVNTAGTPVDGTPTVKTSDSLTGLIAGLVALGAAGASTAVYGLRKRREK